MVSSTVLSTILLYLNEQFMNEKFKTSIPEERARREEQFALIEQTEGFAKLSERQQKLIRVSLYTQQRAERLSDPASEQAVQSERQGYYMGNESTRILEEVHLEHMHEQDPDFYPDPSTRAYKRSQNHVANWYCHPSVYALETECVPGEMPSKVPEGFFEAEYEINESVLELESRIEEAGLPCVVHISENPKNFNEGWHTKHTLLALGKDAEGTMLCWEKEGNTYPFRVVSLKEVYDFYNTISPKYWGVRKLEVRNSGE